MERSLERCEFQWRQLVWDRRRSFVVTTAILLGFPLCAAFSVVPLSIAPLRNPLATFGFEDYRLAQGALERKPWPWRWGERGVVIRASIHVMSTPAQETGPSLKQPTDDDAAGEGDAKNGHELGSNADKRASTSSVTGNAAQSKKGQAAAEKTERRRRKAHTGKRRMKRPTGSGANTANPVLGDMNYLRKRTEHLLRITCDGYTPGGPTPDVLSRKGMKADRRTFNFLIDSWAFSGEADAANMALSLLSRMEELHRISSATDSNSTNSQPIMPDVKTYSRVIAAIGRSGRRDAGEKAELLLKRMDYVYESGANDAARPNTFAYNKVIEAYANSGAKGAAQKAQEWCETMERLRAEGDSEVRPDARSFSSVISAWANSGEEGAAQRAEDCLDRMKELFDAGNADVEPNRFNFNGVISAWAKSGEEGAASRAEMILNRMEELYRNGVHKDVKPTTVSFNAVLDAWAKSGEDGAAARAEEVLRHMEDLYESGENVDAKPNVRSFNTVINCWAKSRHSDAASKAEEVLDLMERLAAAGDDDVNPDATSFSTVINAWGRSHTFGKAERVLNIFRHMTELYNNGNSRCRPNVILYNAVMNACAFSLGDVAEQSRAVDIAHTMLKELQSSPHGKADQVTYGTFLKVCANQMTDSDTRRQVVEVVFKKCTLDGQVGNLVLQQLKGLVSPDVFEKMVGRSPEEHLDYLDLPKQWRCNVIEGKRQRRQRLTVKNKSRWNSRPK